jgi:hypothetical protein
MARIRATIPEFALDWATTGGSQIEPTAGEKAAGWAVGNKPPARKANWLWDAANKWLKVAMASAFGGFSMPDYFNTDSLGHIVWSNLHQVWVAAKAGAATPQTVYYSIDGTHWTAGATVNTTGPDRVSISDTTGRTIITGNSTSLNYISDPKTGTFSTAATGLSSSIAAVRVKDSSDFIMVAGGTQVSVAADVTSTWTQYSTGAVAFADISYVSGTTWVGLSSSGALHISTNDGQTWASQGDVGTALSLGTCVSIDIDPVSGILCAAAQETGVVLGIAYSVDIGATWTAATIENDPFSIGSGKIKILNIGGQVWALCCALDTFMGLFFSVNGGASWKLMTRVDAADQDPYTDFQDMSFNGKQWLAVGDTGQLAKGIPVPT